MTTPANNRFTDPTPFTPLSAMEPQVRDWHIKVVQAKQRYAQTNDPTELQELGVLPKPQEEAVPQEIQAAMDVTKMIQGLEQAGG